MSFTLKGFTVTNAEQARSILVLARLQGHSSESHIVRQCVAVIAKFEASACTS